MLGLKAPAEGISVRIGPQRDKASAEARNNFSLKIEILNISMDKKYSWVKTIFKKNKDDNIHK